MMKIVATNVVASRPPERRPTATATARAKKRERTDATAHASIRNNRYLIDGSDCWSSLPREVKNGRYNIMMRLNDGILFTAKDIRDFLVYVLGLNM